MALPCVRLGAVRLHSGALYRFLCTSRSHQAAAAAEEIEIPRKKTWDKTAVLQALAYTVNHDPTSALYNFQDDPFLTPKSMSDSITFSMSKESGRNAAKYIVNMYPNLFESQLAEPHIPLLMPETVQPQIEGICEEALTERVKLRKVKESVDLYDQLLQAGTPPSLETTNRLLDLLCFYGDREPSSESQPNESDQENENTIDQKYPYSKFKSEVKSWRDNNNAERIFNLMPEKDEHSFRTMIRGMVKHGASSKAFDMYTDLLNNRLTGDVHTFNALITAASRVKNDSQEKWTLILDLLNQMTQQKVQPNLHTFNSVLKSLKKTGLVRIAFPILMEMKALNIEPSLGTFSHFIGTFSKSRNGLQCADILDKILQHIEGKSFTAQDPDDANFFASAMQVCVDIKDLELAYRVDALRNTGDNWKFVGSRVAQSHYYTRLFNIICLQENIDGVLKWYRENVPSRYIPYTDGILDVLHVIEMENRFDLIPQIWKDISLIGYSKKDILIKECLLIMTREKQNPELQGEFANIAADMKAICEDEISFSRMKPSVTILGNIIILLCRAGRSEEAWVTLKSFKSKNLVPQLHVIEELLHCARASGSTNMAIDLVQLAVSYSLPDIAKLAQTTLDEFTLTEEQRITLQDLTQNSKSSSSSSSSDSDHD
ncbi:unnamed protein product [Staurois parvus]|uniref:Small ribosomal subunit protein mS39 n=1 Tax=Staurois parvus TaxID=386267 RepID=A0ABN9B6A4_9NEOB|nr:unnamed protein product [Staurois parvus]